MGRAPRAFLLLPLVQIAWVNSQGLFVLGPIVVGFALFDAALRFGFFTPERRAWWRTVLAASLVTGRACLLNPYFITGALYPLELAGTMSNPIFSKNIAELMPIPDFIRSTTGLWNLPIQLHFATMILGALSFLIPLVWLVTVRLSAGPSLCRGGSEGSARTYGERPMGERNVCARNRRVKSRPAARNRRRQPSIKPAGWRLSPSGSCSTRRSAF